MNSEMGPSDDTPRGCEARFDALMIAIATIERHPAHRATVFLFDRCDRVHGANVADYDAWRDQHSCWLGWLGCFFADLFSRWVDRQAARPPQTRSTRWVDPDHLDAVTKGLL